MPTPQLDPRGFAMGNLRTAVAGCLPRFRERANSNHYCFAFPWRDLPYWLIVWPHEGWSVASDDTFGRTWRPSNDEARQTCHRVGQQRPAFAELLASMVVQ